MIARTRARRDLHPRHVLPRMPLPPQFGAIVHAKGCPMSRHAGERCMCVPAVWSHVPGRIVLTIDATGRVRKELCQ